MEFGKTLRAEREAKGYTIGQISEMTRVLSLVIEGLENENFKMIPAPIYGRGFVKLYCEALGLDPKPFIDGFMKAYNGSTASVSAPTPSAPPPPPSPPPVTAPEPPKRRLPIGADEIPVPNPQRDLFETPVTEVAPPVKTFSRFAPPTPAPEPGFGFSLVQIPWRLVGLILGAIAVIWILVIGCKALSRAFSSEPTPAVQKADGRDKPTAAPSVKRIPKAVKPLYID